MVQGPLKCPTCKQPVTARLERGEQRYEAHRVVPHDAAHPNPNRPYCMTSGNVLDAEAQKRLYRQQLYMLWRQTVDSVDANEEVWRCSHDAAASLCALLTAMGMQFNEHLQDYVFKDDPATPLSRDVL